MKRLILVVLISLLSANLCFAATVVLAPIRIRTDMEVISGENYGMVGVSTIFLETRDGSVKERDVWYIRRYDPYGTPSRIEYRKYRYLASRWVRVTAVLVPFDEDSLIFGRLRAEDLYVGDRFNTTISVPVVVGKSYKLKIRVAEVAYDGALRMHVATAIKEFDMEGTTRTLTSP